MAFDTVAFAAAVRGVSQCDLLASDPDDTDRASTPTEDAHLAAYEAIEACEDAVEEYPGEARFRHLLGRAYEVAGNEAEAARHYRAAVAQSYAAASARLGRMLLFKSEQEGNWNEGRKLLRESAVRGNGASAFAMSMAYRQARGVPYDAKKSVDWLRQSAEAGYAKAQILLARLYLESPTVGIDVERAERWLTAAYEQGNADAAYFLALLYGESPKGFPDKMNEASHLKWMSRAADMGNVEAQVAIGWLLANQEAPTRDPVEAYKWFLVAEHLGSASGRAARIYLEQKMEGAQVLEASRRANQWLSTKGRRQHR